MMAKWIIDPDHSVAAFSIRHLDVANVRGQFNAIHGTAGFDPEERNNLFIELRIDVTGIYTGIRPRDEHLRSPDFFDAETYPAITFQSTEFTPQGGNRGRLTGDLTIHGICRRVTLDTLISGPVRSPEELGGESSLGITASTSVNREDFGMKWNVPLPEGGEMIARNAVIRIDIEADLEEKGG